MSPEVGRGALAVLLGLVPLARALAEGYDAAAEIVQRVGPVGPGRHALTEVAGWELGALLGWSFGLGFVVTYDAAGSSVAEPQRTEALLYLGPLSLTASRERLPEVAPLVGRAAA